MAQNAMHSLSYGLFVVTAKGERMSGCITNTTMQVTTDPNRICIAVNKSNYTHDLIMESRAFNVSVLDESAAFDLFERFGFHSGRTTDKFEGFSDYKLHSNGIAYITRGTNAVICAKVCEIIDLDTHTMFIANVTDSLVLSSNPSATYAYYHANIKPKPKKDASKGKIVWRCTICGYEEEIDELPDDFTCPLCLHPKEDFEKIVG